MVETKQSNTEEWSPTPFAERPSQKLGHADFLKAGVIHALLGGAGGAALGYVVGTALRMSKYGRTALQSLGMLVGAYATSFRLWRKQENAALNVHETLEQYRDLKDMTVDNTVLQEDNRILKQIIAHQRAKLDGPRPEIHAASSEHAMMLAEHAQSQAIH